MSDTIKRRDLLSRKPKVRDILPSDMRWLWAAYQLGGWRDLMDKGLSQEAFEEVILDVVIPEGDYAWILEARGVEGNRPVGIVLAVRVAAGRGIEPFVTWFPWSTPRNQIEATAAFLKRVSKQLKILVFAEENSKHFWDTLIHNGSFIRRGCKINDYFESGKHAMLYYTNGPD